MSIVHSAEIRWIIAGEVPAEIKNWYENDPFCNREKIRVDYYLKFTGDDFIGIKLRQYADGEQNLEFKPIKKGAVSMQLPPGIAGRVDEWDKWSTEAQAAQAFSDLLNPQENAWLALRKARWLRKYSADGDGIKKVDATKKEIRPRDGCNVEFTQLRLGTVDEITENGPELGKPFWTIGFEAFNDEARVKEILEEVMPLELANENCPTEVKQYLRAEHSYAYPDWLAKAR
jgi:hypothetical protein